MALPKEHTYTIDDIYALPDGERAELINGQIYYMAPPSRKHQDLSMELSGTIREYIRSHKGSCKVYAAPFAVYLDETSDTYVEPDISVICDKNKLDDRGCKGAPDWIIEIVSPSSKQLDYLVKLLKYQSTGVREYWIVDPRRKTVTVNYFGKNLLNIQYSFDSIIKVNIYEDLYIDFSEISSRLSD